MLAFLNKEISFFYVDPAAIQRTHVHRGKLQRKMENLDL
jgi:hypothetical protein